MSIVSKNIIISPIITEHAMDGFQQKKYTFKVAKHANKIQITKAIEEIFKVDVEKVTTMNCRGRYVRHGQSRGYKPDWKKAIVKLTKKSKTIKFFDNLS